VALKYYYSYEEFVGDVSTLAFQISPSKFDAIIGIARGGLTLAHFLATKLELRDLFTINSISYNEMEKNSDIKIFNIPDLSGYKKVLIVDDIVDSGETMDGVVNILKDKFPNLELKIASLFYKQSAIIKPDFTIKEANLWIEFFWEVD
jgi:xanthine phosphoribosyltransferase